jgi:hypothetical protein
MSKEQTYYVLNEHWNLNRGDVIVKIKIASKSTTLTPVTDRPRNSFGWQLLKPIPSSLDRLWDNGKIVIRDVPRIYEGEHRCLNDWGDGTHTLYIGGEPFELVPTEGDNNGSED